MAQDKPGMKFSPPAELFKQTSMPRNVDPTYRPHQLIILLTVLSGVLAGALQLAATPDDFGAAVVAGLTIGAVAFVTWVLAREVDPDKEYGSHVAALLATLAALAIWTPLNAGLGFGADVPPMALLGMALLLFLTRIVNRSVGYAAKLGDYVVILVVTGIVAFASQHWILALVTMNAFMLDAWFKPANRKGFLFAVLVVPITAVALYARGLTLLGGDEGATGIEVFALGVGEAGTLSALAAILAALIATGYFFTLFCLRRVDTLADQTDEPLTVPRVRATMGLALLAAIVSALWGGDAAMISLSPLWMLLLGLLLYRLPENIALLNAQRMSSAAESQDKQSNQEASA